jgi:tripartite-type tricarboxylate transporter receptor subunit TctC
MKQASNLIVGLLALPIAQTPLAQTKYPEKPIRMVVSSVPGSPTDIIARVLGQKFAETLGQSLVIDNAAGAAGSIGADRVAKAAPDGYTLGTLGFGPLVVNPTLYKLAYDPLKDFAPVTQLNAMPNMLLVHSGVPVKSVKDLIVLAKAQPGVLFPIAVAVPMTRDGKLRALAVTSLRRSSAAPELPTIDESGYPGFEVTGWNGLLAPARTPAAIVRKLHFETVRALALPDVRARIAELGMEGIGNSSAEFAAVIGSEIPKWAKVIKEAGIKPD